MSDSVTEALPHIQYGAERGDVESEVPELAAERVVDEKLSQVKDFLDQYFAEKSGTIQKRAVRLLRLGK